MTFFRTALVAMIVAFLLMGSIAVSLSGPPPSADRPRRSAPEERSRSSRSDQSYNQSNQQPSQGDQGGSGSSGYSFSGGVGPASVAGGVGGSPQFCLSGLAHRDIGRSFRLAYSHQNPGEGYVQDVAVSAELLSFGFSGQFVYDDIPWLCNAAWEQAVPGDRIDAAYTMNYYRLILDMNLLDGNIIYGDAELRLGPRFELFQYTDSFNWTNATTQWGSERKRRYGMPGIGLVGSFRGPRYGTSLLARIAPQIKFAVSTGSWHGMRFSAYEVFAEWYPSLGSRPDFYSHSYATTQRVLGIELGYMVFRINETIDRRNHCASGPLPGSIGAFRTGDADYTLYYPLARLTLNF